jgi:hypothetical protein
MKRSFCLSIALACSFFYQPAVQAGVIAMPPPGPARIAKADAVIVGKVEAIEPTDVKVGSINYRIAVVRINQGIRGIKDEKTLRVGFIPVEKAKPGVFVTGARAVQLEAGQDGLFLLTRVGKENFYTIGGVVGYFFNSSTTKDFAKEVAAAKVAAKAVENPLNTLKAKDAEERLMAAAILIDKHRTFRGPNAKQEPIDAGESKLILQALADADWQGQFNFASLRPNPMQVFQRLGVTAKDGFMPAPGTNYQTTAQNWLRENAQKYRIQRFVAAEGK